MLGNYLGSLTLGSLSIKLGRITLLSQGCLEKIFNVYVVLRQRRQWHPTPVLLPGESQGKRSLVGCRLWGRTESDTLKQLSSSSSSSSIVLRMVLIKVLNK